MLASFFLSNCQCILLYNFFHFFYHKVTLAVGVWCSSRDRSLGLDVSKHVFARLGLGLAMGSSRSWSRKTLALPIPMPLSLVKTQKNYQNFFSWAFSLFCIDTVMHSSSNIKSASLSIHCWLGSKDFLRPSHS